MMQPNEAAVIVVNTIAERSAISELELVAVLESRGFSHVEAEKLCAFVPSAFAWALLERMGVQSFPSYYTAVDKTGREIQLPLDREPYFTAALQLASETIKNGWSPILTREKFERVANRSAEMGAANKLLHSGGSLAGAELLPLRVFRIPAEPASES
jgi:hypothetical protein